jgi:molecular chaperone HscB
MEQRTFFEVLGVPRAYHLRVDDLEAQYRALSKQLHPDRFAKAAPKERMQALSRSTELNDAYRVLKNEVKRAEYLLKLEGLDVADEKSASVKPQPALLMEMMELNEQLADARAEGADGKVKALADAVRAQQAEALRTVDGAFARWEKGDRAALDEIAQALIAMRYHARFLEQAELADGEEGAM